MANKPIPINSAKEELVKINDALTEPHVLIGGLAVQQYVIGRPSKDIDLICEHQKVIELIGKLYPTKDYIIKDENEDEYRPSFIVTHRFHDDKIIFLGPKIWEREAYMGINWDELKQGAQPFSYQGKKLTNILVPAIELLAFTKLLSFLGRTERSPEKGKQDLVDFVNLTNHKDFRFNTMIDEIRKKECGDYISDKINKLDTFDEVWQQSLLYYSINLLGSITNKKNVAIKTEAVPQDPENLYSVANSPAFYDLVANKYDERNTDQVLETHKKIITYIDEELRKKGTLKVLDIGSGTGRLVAFQFLNQENLTWHGVEPSVEMCKRFRTNLSGTKINLKLFEYSVFELKEKLKESEYDVIIMSFMLTSLSEMPDFEIITRLLSDNGFIVIADIAPFYTQSKPLYGFQLADKTITLAPKLVDPLEIAEELLKQHLSLKEISRVEKVTGEKYSFVLKFQR